MDIEELLQQIENAKELCPKLGIDWDKLLFDVPAEFFGAHVDHSVWWMDWD